MAGTRVRAAGEADPPLLGVALISAAALAYEILLMRLFSIILWHHFAYMIISLALLGYGASGAVLTLVPGALQRRFVPLFSAAAAAFGLSAGRSAERRPPAGSAASKPFRPRSSR